MSHIADYLPEQAGSLQPVIGELRSHAPRREIGGGTAAYFESNRTRMDYPRCPAAGLPIGSGPVEGA